MMVRRYALAVIFVSMLAIAGGYASAFLPGGPPPIAAWVFALATAAMMVAVLVLGAARRNAPLGKLVWVFVFCFVALAGGFGLALKAPAVTPDAKLFMGLPAGAAVILFVVGLLPLLVLPVAYAITFDKTTLNTEELEQLRAQLEEMRRAREPEQREVLR